MKNTKGIIAITAGLFLTIGVSTEALADPGKRASAYRSSHVAAHAVKAGQARYRRAGHKRGVRRAIRHSHGHYRAPRRYRSYASHTPRKFHRYHRYPRHYRYSRYHREVNAGAVVAGLILGGIVYEILTDDRHYEEVYYVRD